MANQDNDQDDDDDELDLDEDSRMLIDTASPSPEKRNIAAHRHDGQSFKDKKQQKTVGKEEEGKDQPRPVA